MPKKNTRPRKPKMRKPRRVTRANVSPYGPVTTINTAPVAIGNSVRGAKAKVVNLPDGVHVIGRDFGFTLAPTSTLVSNWSIAGGMPLTPSCLPSSILRNYTQMYGKFKIVRLQMHYITSSATSESGDIMFYYERDRQGPMVDFTSSSFLPYVLSDPNTVIGPQWTNHTLFIKPTDEYNFTDYGLNTDLNEDTCGSVFIFTKTNSANSPGYVIFDYEIIFKELSVSPRAGTLPIARAQWFNTCVGSVAAPVVVGGAFGPAILGSSLNAASSVMVTGATSGDIYKVIVDYTNSRLLNPAWVGSVSAIDNTNLIGYRNGTFGAPVDAILADGSTFYALWANNTLIFFPNLESAKTASNPMVTTAAQNITFYLNIWISYVGSDAALAQATY